MKRFVNTNGLSVVAGVLVALAASGCNGFPASAQTADEQVLIVPSAQGPSRLSMTGTTTEFGRFVATGEITFPADEQGQLQDGTGIAVVQAEDGDQIVADVTARIGDEGNTEYTLHWRDSVTFSDGAVVQTTGRFVDDKPPGLTQQYICSSVCCVEVCPPPIITLGCRDVCFPCNCRWVFVDRPVGPVIR